MTFADGAKAVAAALKVDTGSLESNCVSLRGALVGLVYDCLTLRTACLCSLPPPSSLSLSRAVSPPPDTQEAFFVGDDMPNGRFLTDRKSTDAVQQSN